MNEELTEEEMRQALFGSAEPLSQAHSFPVQNTHSDIATLQSAKAAEKKSRESVHAQVESHAAGRQ